MYEEIFSWIIPSVVVLSLIGVVLGAVHECDIKDRNFKICMEQKKDIDQCKEWAK
jgi:hypothetical protein